MWWWEYVIVTGLLLFGIYVFLMGTGYLPMILSHGYDLTADNMDDKHAKSLRNQRRHGVEWKDVESITRHSDRSVDRAA